MRLCGSGAAGLQALCQAQSCGGAPNRVPTCGAAVQRKAAVLRAYPRYGAAPAQPRLSVSAPRSVRGAARSPHTAPAPGRPLPARSAPRATTVRACAGPGGRARRAALARTGPYISEWAGTGLPLVRVRPHPYSFAQWRPGPAMEDSSMDIESMGPLRPQTFLFGNVRRGRALPGPAGPIAPAGPGAERRAGAMRGRGLCAGEGPGALSGPGLWRG